MHTLGIPHTPATSPGSQWTGPPPLLYSWRDWWTLGTDRMAPSNTPCPSPTPCALCSQEPLLPHWEGTGAPQVPPPLLHLRGPPASLCPVAWGLPEPTVHQALACVTWGQCPRVCSWQSPVFSAQPPRQAFWKAGTARG